LDNHAFICQIGDGGYKAFMKILNSLKDETLVIQNAKDVYFFVNAMGMASKQFCDRQAGEMINELLLTNDNYKFIGNAYKVIFFHLR